MKTHDARDPDFPAEPPRSESKAVEAAPTLTERLRGYNPPDRTVDEQRQTAVDIAEAADRIEELERRLREVDGLTNDVNECGHHLRRYAYDHEGQTRCVVCERDDLSFRLGSAERERGELIERCAFIRDHVFISDGSFCMDIEVPRNPYGSDEEAFDAAIDAALAASPTIEEKK